MRRGSLVEMRELQPDETQLTGDWIVDGSTVVGDDVCRRIKWLVDSRLEQVTTTGWETLFRDPNDGRLWERTYPQGEMHGGGPPQLSVVSEESASSKYRVGAA
jgi:Immunity protein 27